MANLHLEASLPSVRLRTLGEGESAIAERVHAVLRGSSEIRSSFCVHAGGVDVLLESEQRGVLADAADAVERELAPEFFARGIIEFEELLLETLRDRRETLAVAESCTGGLLAARLSAVPGCSDVFHGGVVAYANSVKHELLGVSDSLLASEGAVSEATALAMARGVRERLAATWSLSITGIAGPDGGSPEKPVGTTWLGCVGPHTEATQLLRLPGNREQNRVWAAARALHQLAVTMGGQRSDH